MLPLSTNIFTGVEEGITSALIVEARMKKGIMPLKMREAGQGSVTLNPNTKEHFEG